MIICRQRNEKKERLIELFNVSAEKARKAKVPVTTITLGGKYNCKVFGFSLKDKYFQTHYIGVCADDHCIYFISGSLSSELAIKSQLNKNEWKEVIERIMFEAFINDKLNNAFDSTPTTEFNV